MCHGSPLRPETNSLPRFTKGSGTCGAAARAIRRLRGRRRIDRAPQAGRRASPTQESPTRARLARSLLAAYRHLIRPGRWATPEAWADLEIEFAFAIGHAVVAFAD